MSAHTPGPWFINDQYADAEIRGPQDSGVLIAVMSPWGVAAETPSPQRANARLIAAAPELLKAMQDLFGAELEKCMAYDGHDDQMQAVAKARAAIAKATGEGA